MAKILVVDDERSIRNTLKDILEFEKHQVTLAENGKEGLELAENNFFDLIFSDIRMPEMDGVEATRRIVAAGLPTKVLVLTTFDLDEYVFAALKAGASGFMLKDARPDDLLSAIRAVAAGDAVVAPSATRRLLQQVVPKLPDVPGHDSSRLDVLTDREREVLVEIARGATNSEIAANLFMAEGTVKTHVGRLLSKLNARDRVGLVLIAFETGLVD